MATFTNIPDSSLAQDQPFTQSLGRALRDNPLAIADGDGTAPRVKHPGSAKAWVNFNGTGTLAIRSSFNIGSVTDNGVGQYTLNFASPMLNQTYVVVGSCQNWTGSTSVVSLRPTSGALPTVSACPIQTSYVFGNTGANFDPDWAVVAVFGYIA